MSELFGYAEISPAPDSVNKGKNYYLPKLSKMYDTFGIGIRTLYILYTCDGFAINENCLVRHQWICITAKYS
jgi:hypothetical protein